VGSEANLQITDLPAGNYIMSIYNTGGQLISSGSLVHGGGSATETLSLRGVQPGMYSIQLSGGIILKKTFVVQ
jgi:hypothetical protein